jgi:integrase/recombinase XerD
MNFHLLFHPASPASRSPYRVVDEQGRETALVNEFLDAQHVRGLSPCSLRAYGYDCLYFARWWFNALSPLAPPDLPRPFSAIDESTLFDYLRYQLDQDPKPQPQTVYHRLSSLRCLYRFHHGREIPRCTGGASGPRPRSPFGYAGPRHAATALLKRPRQLVVPLSPQDVAIFWSSFHTYRDLSLIALMLLDGLRSHEVLRIALDDLCLAQKQIWVHGKGNKQRLLPLPEDAIQAIESYLHLERPTTNSSQLFVSLKGQRRGQPMTPAGLRSLFRHHRRQTQVTQANPHRFRHTYGADMVRAGVSLPALMRLMGHAHIHTTMLYVQLSPHDVWQEYHRALATRHPLPPPPSL